MPDNVTNPDDWKPRTTGAGSARRNANNGEQTLERRYDPAPHDPLDVSGIPAADEYERRDADAERAKARSDAERILAAVKAHLDGGRKALFDPVGRGGNLSSGGIALANGALAPLQWRVQYRATREGPLEQATRWTLERIS